MSGWDGFVILENYCYEREMLMRGHHLVDSGERYLRPSSQNPPIGPARPDASLT
jgi:hypothetical protein